MPLRRYVAYSHICPCNCTARIKDDFDKSPSSSARGYGIFRHYFTLPFIPLFNALNNAAYSRKLSSVLYALQLLPFYSYNITHDMTTDEGIHRIDTR